MTMNNIEGMPLGTEWYRCSTREIREMKIPGKLPVVKQGSPNPSIQLRAKSEKTWVIKYGGNLEEYEPGYETLQDALNIPLPKSSLEPPPEEVVQFLKNGVHSAYIFL